MLAPPYACPQHGIPRSPPITSLLSEVLCFLLLPQDEVDSVAGEANRSESEDSSLDGNEIPHRDLFLLSEGSESDDDDSEYEDCQEDEEEDWQTCSEDDSNPEEGQEEGGCDRDQKEHGPEDSEAQSRASPENSQMSDKSRLVSKQELLELFKRLHTGKKVKDGQLTVGLVRCRTLKLAPERACSPRPAVTTGGPTQSGVCTLGNRFLLLVAPDIMG